MYYKNKLKAILNTRVIDEMSIIENQLQIAMIFTILNKSNVYIWAENDLHTLVRIFKTYGVNIKKVVSISKEIDQVDGIKIISPDELKFDKTENKFFFLVPQDYLQMLNYNGGVFNLSLLIQ